MSAHLRLLTVREEPIRVYDPRSGSGGMFVLSEKFIEAHRGKLGDISCWPPFNDSDWRGVLLMAQGAS